LTYFADRPAGCFDLASWLKGEGQHASVPVAYLTIAPVSHRIPQQVFHLVFSSSTYAPKGRCIAHLYLGYPGLCGQGLTGGESHGFLQDMQIEGEQELILTRRSSGFEMGDVLAAG
jgi:hypothetical protein